MNTKQMVIKIMSKERWIENNNFWSVEGKTNNEMISFAKKVSDKAVAMLSMYGNIYCSKEEVIKAIEEAAEEVAVEM